ncbi:hypothetical protein CAPTEDRAFT_163206 [Capitella teleta]|nr:hypothetical protein CAPTEDRAFT_163206 [Capitella teleta]|eukprot:ELU18395.1 hypothetical protein CAPTEDRAFT_163206 [Capitella teleta]
MQWIRAISNHLWYSASTCKKNAQLLKEKWLSVLHHVAGVHSWSGGQKFNKCDHGPMSDAPPGMEVAYLKRTSPAFKALKDVVSAPALLKLLPKLTKFCHTGTLEVFHSFLLRFCSKRQYFPYPGMKARLMLAALSWNALQRSNATEKVDVVKWSKRKGAWVLEKRRKKQASDSVPPQLKSLMSRVVEVASQHLQLPPIAEPKLQRRGCHVAKPSKEELRHL